MRRVKPNKPEQRLTLQSVNGFEDIVFEAKAKAKTIEFCHRAVLDFEASPRGHHPCCLPCIPFCTLCCHVGAVVKAVWRHFETECDL